MSNNSSLLCYCGLELFFDDDGTWSCPARFRGDHTDERQREWNEKHTQITQDRRRAGALGGAARAQNLPADRRSAIARNAARTRWSRDQ